MNNVFLEKETLKETNLLFFTIFYLPGDSLGVHNNMEFSTHDNDNDAVNDLNCAAKYGGGGNWWGNDCGIWMNIQNMNGLFGSEGDSGLEFVTWGGFHGYSYFALKTMKLIIRSAV